MTDGDNAEEKYIIGFVPEAVLENAIRAALQNLIAMPDRIYRWTVQRKHPFQGMSIPEALATERARKVALRFYQRYCGFEFDRAVTQYDEFLAASWAAFHHLHGEVMTDEGVQQRSLTPRAQRKRQRVVPIKGRFAIAGS